MTTNALQKSNLGEIEIEATTTQYYGETFFSLFAEQQIVYEQVYDQLAEMESEREVTLNKDQDDGDSSIDSLLSEIGYALLSPTPFSVVGNDHITDLNILKQCLLFR